MSLIPYQAFKVSYTNDNIQIYLVDVLLASNCFYFP